MEQSIYQQYLYRSCNPEDIIRLSNIVFKEGHLERIDDLILSILPLANIIYYKYIKRLDDREYAKEDLISDAILRIYQDMTLRWDKYIHIDAYYEYFSAILKNGMIGLVHSYHNYYSSDDIDLEATKLEDDSEDIYEAIDIRIAKDSIQKGAIDIATRILKCRRVNTKLLLNILKCMYIDKEGIESLRSRVRVLGISNNLFNFYCEHVVYVYKLACNYQYAHIGGKTKMISRISNTIDRFEDTTYRILSSQYYDSIIPEIYAEFGAEIAKKFVKTFSNRTIKVPDYKDFCDDLLGGVVLTLANGDKMNLYDVAENYQISYKILARIYNKAIKYID